MNLTFKAKCKKIITAIEYLNHYIHQKNSQKKAFKFRLQPISQNKAHKFSTILVFLINLFI